MADAIDRFLNQRAREDYRDLNILHALTTDGMRLFALYEPAVERAIAHAYASGQMELHPEHEPITETSDFMVHRNTLDMAGAFGLTMAGEACKAIERTQPDLMRDMPDFPWAALKRLRNHHAHPAQDLHIPQRQQRKNEAIAKNLREYEAYIDAHNVPEREKTDAELALSMGIRIHQAMRILASGQAEENLIPLQGTSNVKRATTLLCEEKYRDDLESMLPVLVLAFCSYTLTHEINDTLGRITCFNRAQPDSALGDKQMRNMLVFRNHMAHFAGTLCVTDWTKLPTGIEHPAKDIQRLNSALNKLPDPEDTAAANDFTHQLAQRYKTDLLGNAASDPAKYQVLNETVQNIYHADLSDSLKNAYIQSAALLIQRMPADRAKQFLDYVLSSPDQDLQDPNRLKVDSDCPYVVRNHLRDFTDNVAAFSASPGANRRINGRMH